MLKNVFPPHTEEEESGKETFHAISSRHLYTSTCYREPLGHGIGVVHAPIQNETSLSRKEVKGIIRYWFKINFTQGKKIYKLTHQVC